VHSSEKRQTSYSNKDICCTLKARLAKHSIFLDGAYSSVLQSTIHYGITETEPMGALYFITDRLLKRTG
jgi:hypothetical protein